jgi:signal transduction histidine kinase
LHKQIKTVASLEERQRLARDLHDAVSQTLFTSSIISEALLHMWKHQPDQIEENLQYLVRLNQGAMAEMRTLLMELRPMHLTEADLPTKLEQLIKAVRARKEIDIKLEVDDGEPLPPDVQIAFYRIAQEAFNNIMKYARAQHVWVHLLSDAEKVALQIRDDGRGFEPDTVAGGMGLSTMRERATAINAVFTVESAPRKGTTVQVTWSRNPPRNIQDSD